MAKKRTYKRAFKLQALELVKSGQKSINEIERALGITPGLLDKWKARMKVDGVQAFPGKGRLKEDEELIRWLKGEIEVLGQGGLSHATRTRRCRVDPTHTRHFCTEWADLWQSACVRAIQVAGDGLPPSACRSAHASVFRMVCKSVGLYILTRS